MTLLAVSALSKSFGSFKAVSDVGFTVLSGEMVALVGGNGAGKSTCFDMIGGQIAPDAGSILLDGREMVGTPSYRLFRLGLGRTFQADQLFDSMTVCEAVQISLLSAGYRLFQPFASARRAHVLDAMQVLEEVGIAALAERPCGGLTHVERKWVELAMVIADRPRLLLMDEPTAGMAPDDRAALMALVAGLTKTQGMGVLFVEEDLGVVFDHADRIMLMQSGRIVTQGSRIAMRDDPQMVALLANKAIPPKAPPV